MRCSEMHIDFRCTFYIFPPPNFISDSSLLPSLIYWTYSQSFSLQCTLRCFSFLYCQFSDNTGCRCSFAEDTRRRGRHKNGGNRCSELPLWLLSAQRHFLLSFYWNERNLSLLPPFSFGYPSEQSLWTAHPFTAINNSLPSSSPPPLRPAPHPAPPPPPQPQLLLFCSSPNTAICSWACCLGLSPPSSSPSLSLWFASPAPVYNLTGQSLRSAIILVILCTTRSENPAGFPRRLESLS